MFTAEDDQDTVHPWLTALIAQEKRVCGCAMTAMKNVARKTGVHDFFVRRIIGRYGKVKIQLHQARNIFKAYRDMKRAQIRQRREAKRFSLTENSINA